MKRVDPIKRAIELRKTLIKRDEVLVADFSNTLQGKDTSRVVDLMPNVKTGEYVFRAKVNVKNIDPIACEQYGVEYFEIHKKGYSEISDFIKKQEFDFPLWFKHDKDFNMKRVLDYNLPFITQVAGCNFHDGTNTGGCFYCFVDDVSNDGVRGTGKSFLNPKDAVNSFVVAKEKVENFYRTKGVHLNMKVLRISGGEPTIALDWILDAWRYIGAQGGLGFVGQIDSNLSTGYLVKEFEEKGIYEKNILNKLGEHPIKILTAIKGVNNENINSNVQSTATMDAQFYSIKRFLEAGFDIYPQMYNPDPKVLPSYLEKMDSKISNFSLRVHVGPLKMYGPNKQRIENLAQLQGKNSEEFVQRFQNEWDFNYKNGCEVLNDYLQKTYGANYKDVVRSDVDLRIK